MMVARQMNFDGSEVERALGLLVDPGATFEIRALGAERGRETTWSGYFVDNTLAARAIVPICDVARGVYVTLNPVDPKLRARKKDRIEYAQKGSTTGDQHIVKRSRLLIDIDAERPSGISSSDIEHRAAIDVAAEMSYELGRLGWPEPLHADSGNGGHLVYAIDLPAADDGLVARVLAKAAERWNCRVGEVALKVDTSVANPARISKVYGTLTRKGDSVDDRTHRLSRIITAPASLAVVPRELLEAFAGPAPRAEPKTRPTTGAHRHGEPLPTLDVAGWLAKHGLAVKTSHPNNDGTGTVYELEACPFNGDHDRGEAWVIQLGSGAISAGCQHESCRWGWEQLRDDREPERRQRREEWERRQFAPRAQEPHPFAPVDQGGLPSHLRIIDGGAGAYEEATAAPASETKPERRGKRWGAVVDELYRRAKDPWVALKLVDVELVSLRIGSYAVMIGPEGSGKSSLLLQMLAQHARDTGPAIYVTPELDADEAAGRVIGQDKRATWKDVLLGHVPREHVLDHPRLVMLDRDDATMSTLEVEIDALAAEYPGQPILVAWDYIQASPGDSEGERLRVAKLSADLRRFSKRKQVVTIGASQSSRDGAKKLTSGELVGREASRAGAESAQIERDGYVVFSIGDYTEREDGRSGRSVSLGKNRMGKGDVVFAAIYDGATGLWEVENTARPAADVRAEKEGKGEAARITAAELAMLQAAEKSEAPLTRDQLRELAATKKDYARRAVANLLARGDLVEVTRRAPRSRSFMVWTRARATEAKVAINEGSDDRYS